MNGNALNEREQRILGAVVSHYLQTGRPVASKVLADMGVLGLGAATIRNVMAALERCGYLCAPHTSAGRVPTDAGLRYFVDTLLVVDTDMRETIERSLSAHAQEVERSAILRRASSELANRTHLAGLAWIREPAPRGIERLELVPVSATHVLAVIVIEQGLVKNKLLRRPAGLGEKQLHRMALRLNELLRDCSLEEVRLRLQAEMRSDRLRMRHLLEDLKHWAESPNQDQPDLFVSGQRHLLDLPELAVVDTIRSLMAAFEDKERLLHLVRQVEEEATGVKVFIGSEHALADMDQVAVVLSRYQGSSDVVGTLGVIGPKRMQYERVMPIVDGTARWVSKMLGGMK